MATESVDDPEKILNELVYEKLPVKATEIGWEKVGEDVNDALQRLDAYYTRESAKLEKAYGGCRVCYGKGYATVNDRWGGVDTDQDIGSPGGTVSGGNPNAMKFCTCDRGKQLQERWASYTRECARKVLEGLDDAFRRLEERVEYNRHDMGEFGMFIRVGYVKNFLNDTKAELRAAIQEVGGGEK